MSTKLPQSVLILTLGCRRALNARHVSDQPGQRYITELRAQRGHPLIRSERKEEVFAALYHAREHGLSQRIAGIDEDVIGLEAIKLESKLNHFVRRCSAQRVAQVESTSGHLGGDRLRGAKRQESAWLAPLFDEAEREARRRRGKKVAHQLAVDGERGQQARDGAHALSSWATCRAAGR